MIRIVCLLMMIVFLPPAYGLDTWYGKGRQGWHFYDDPVKEVEPEKPQELEEDSPLEEMMPNPDKEKDPLKWAEAVRQQGEWLKARALREPGEANTLAYIRYQNEVANKANVFAETWPHVMRKNPAEDFEVSNPTTQLGRHVLLDEKKAQTAKNIKILSERYGLLFFYSSQCDYCKVQAPIVASVAKNFGLALLGISLDHGFLSDIENSEPDNGMAEELGIKGTPVLLAVDHEQGDIIPVHAGLISGDDLAKLLSEIVSYENIS